jgi:hypothetical protein
MSDINGNFSDGQFTLTDAAGHSATLVAPNGDCSISGVVIDGREVEHYESRGATTGLRLGKRKLPTISVSAIAANPSNVFDDLNWGRTSGYISTAASIGDAKSCTLDCIFDYNGEVRSYRFERCYSTGVDRKQGSPDAKTYNWTCAGSIWINGTIVYTAP